MIDSSSLKSIRPILRKAGKFVAGIAIAIAEGRVCSGSANTAICTRTALPFGPSPTVKIRANAGLQVGDFSDIHIAIGSIYLLNSYMCVGF